MHDIRLTSIELWGYIMVQPYQLQQSPEHGGKQDGVIMQHMQMHILFNRAHCKDIISPT